MEVVKIPKGRGRPKKYESEEERKIANNASSAKHMKKVYMMNKEDILIKRREERELFKEFLQYKGITREEYNQFVHEKNTRLIESH